MAEASQSSNPDRLVTQLKNVLLELTRNPFPFLPSPHDLKKRASVALIIRIKPGYSQWPEQPVDISSSGESALTDDPEVNSRSIESFFAKDWVQHGDPEVLFIKRATRIGDKWTGHVALPGGGRESGDKDDRAAAIRETFEEVGVDLSPDNAISVGNLPQRLVTSSWGKIPLMVLCPYVFLISRHDLPPLKLQPTEVAGAHWVPIRELLSSKFRTFEWQDVSGRISKKDSLWHPKRLYYRFMLGHMLFSAVKLMPTESVLSTSEAAITAETIQEKPPGIINGVKTWFTETTGLRPTFEKPLLLWGLTLGVMADFLELLPPHNALQLWNYPTFSPLDVRFLIWLLSWRFRNRKYEAMQDIPATVPASIELGLDSIPMPHTRDEAWIKEHPPCSGEAGLGINPYEGPPRKRVRRGSRSSRVGFMLEGYYDIISRGILVSIIFRSSLLLVIAAYAIRRLRRR